MIVDVTLWLVPIVVFVAFVLVGLTAHTLIGRMAGQWRERGRTNVPRLVFSSIRRFVLLWAVLIGIGVATHLVSLPANVQDYIDRTVVILLILSATFPAVTIASNLFQTIGGHVEQLAPLSGMLTRILQVVIWAIVLLMILSYLNINIAPALTTLGITGLAVALAFQDTLANFFAGFYILADRPVRVGDYIKLGSGEEGYVVDIGWRSTRMRTLANNLVVVPNLQLGQNIVTNFSLPQTPVMVSVPVRVGLESDPDQVERVLLEVSNEAVGQVPGLLAEPAPFVRFVPGIGDYWLGFTVYCRVNEFVDQFYAQHYLSRRILTRLREEGIRVPLPATTIDWLEHQVTQTDRGAGDNGGRG